MSTTAQNHSIGFRFLSLTLLVVGMFGQHAVADSVSFSPAIGNALTPFTVIVEGFIGTNGPVPVSGGGAGIGVSCSNIRPCTTEGNMGYYSGKQWVVVSAVVDGVGVVVSNFFTVREAGAYLSRACGPSGTKVIVTGYDFARDSIIYVDTTQTQADTKGNFAATVNIPEGQTGPFQIIASDGTRRVTNTFNIGPSAVCEEDLGHVRDLGGSPTVRRPGGQPQPLAPGDPIRFGDVVTTGPGGRAEVTFMDGTDLTIAPNGSVEVNNYIYDPANSQNDSSVLNFLSGAFTYVSGLIGKHEDNVRVNSPMGYTGIRGTEFISRRDPCSTTQEVYLIHGQLAIKPTYSVVTNIVDAPATIFYDATNVVTSGLTQAAYDALKAEINQTNPVTFGDWLVGYFGCTNGNPSAAATADPDGDRQNNYAEFLAHTDPTTNASVFRLISGTREGNGVRLLWQTHGGVTNVVQAASSIGGTYADISPNFVIPGDADVTTNYLDVGITTNGPARFYRIELAD
jgi:hypothetical protein